MFEKKGKALWPSTQSGALLLALFVNCSHDIVLLKVADCGGFRHPLATPYVRSRASNMGQGGIHGAELEASVGAICGSMFRRRGDRHGTERRAYLLPGISFQHHELQPNRR